MEQWRRTKAAINARYDPAFEAHQRFVRAWKRAEKAGTYAARLEQTGDPAAAVEVADAVRLAEGAQRAFEEFERLAAEAVRGPPGAAAAADCGPFWATTCGAAS